MSDMAETFKAMNDYAQAKRRDNTIKSTRLLKLANVEFVSKNNGAHLIVLNRWDYWPSTGLFIDRSNQKRGRGITNLLRIIAKQNKGA